MTRLTRDQLLAQVRQSVPEITPVQVNEWMNNGKDVLVVDIRERDEWVQGHVPEAWHLSRSFLELQIEQIEPERESEVVLYCAGGVRSLLAARNLQEMGYEHVYSMIGGFNGWKNAGLRIDVPRFLSDAQRERYDRHIILPDVGEAGQIRLLDSKVLLIGAGGLGSPAALYLAAAGVGTIGIVDYDNVDRSNLQRQILHGESTIGVPKVESAIARLKDLNPDIEVIGYRQPIRSDNAFDILRGYDVVLNGSDNFPTRYLVNDACHLLGIPLVDASIFMLEGQVTVYQPKNLAQGIEGGPCYRCLYPDPPPPGEVPSCAEAGVFGVLPGIVGSVQAAEAIKLIIGLGEPLIGRLLMYDALEQGFRTLNIRRDPACPLCGEHPTVTELIDYEQFCGLPSMPTPTAVAIPA
ncbi:MAG: molybdopterin-synthase adenylyltransferase MoeB [Caldilineales bacterium]|nr:molybdopterin-synthase adenylyltransferase MoeB [Caldilineales bacterium]